MYEFENNLLRMLESNQPNQRLTVTPMRHARVLRSELLSFLLVGDEGFEPTVP